MRETGLMQEHFVVDKLVGRVKEWVYRIRTLNVQEFVSAVWLSYQKWTKQCMITRYLVSSDELFFMFKMVISFVCDILCDKAAAMLSILRNYFLKRFNVYPSLPARVWFPFNVKLESHLAIP